MSLHVGGLRPLGSGQPGVQRSQDLVDSRRGQIACALPLPRQNMKVLRPQHGGVQLLIECRTIQRLRLQDLRIALHRGLKFALLHLGLGHGHFPLALGLLPVVADQPRDAPGDAAKQSNERSDNSDHFITEGNAPLPAGSAVIWTSLSLVF